MQFGAAKGKGRNASIQNETMEIPGWRHKNNSVLLLLKKFWKNAFWGVIIGFQETEEQIITRILWKHLYSHIRNWSAMWPWKSTFWVLIWTSFQRTVVLRVTSMVNVSTRTLQQWRAGKKGNKAHQCLLIIAGPWCIILPIRRSVGRQRRPDCTRAIRNLRLMK
jgi:hypothetical protein